MRGLKAAIILLLCVAIAYAAGSHSFSRINPVSEPQSAALADGKAPVRFAERRLPATMEGVDMKALETIALKSLETDPLNPRAIRMLALNARSLGKAERVAKLAELSHTLTRRDATTNLLLIESRATDPNVRIENILELYDVTLRADPEYRERLYPALVEVMDNPKAREALVPYVQNEAIWMSGMMNAALKADHGPRAVADVLMRSHNGKSITFARRFSSATLFDTLYARGEYALMKELFIRVKNTDPSWLSSTEFSQKMKQGEYGILAWQSKNTSDAGAELVATRSPEDYAYEIFALSGNGGVVLQRLLFAEPGQYRVAINAEGNFGQGSASASLVMSCLDEEARTSSVIATMAISASAKQWDVQIPCNVQLLQIEARGGDTQTGLSSYINKIALRKLADGQSY